MCGTESRVGRKAYPVFLFFEKISVHELYDFLFYKISATIQVSLLF